ncbi:MAG: hypothetical protein N3B11_01525 [Coriobacteriia bacterium]|nr:hypothetical protein [Coriobacteriia bacterium]
MRTRSLQVTDLVRSGAELDSERSRDVLLQVVVEIDAPQALVDRLREQLRPTTGKARLAISVAGAGEPLVLEQKADALVVAAGGLTEDVRRLLKEARERLLPAVVLAVVPGSERAVVVETAGHPAADVLTDVDVRRLVDDRLAGWLAEEIPSKRLALARNLPFMRGAVAEAAVRATAWQNAAIGTMGFIPGADMPVMTANQIKMLLQIAAAYGEPLGPERIKELLAVVGGGFVFRAIARQVVGIVPIVGWAVKGAIGYSGTLAMGKAAIAYFENGADLATVARAVVGRAAGEARG